MGKPSIYTNKSIKLNAFINGIRTLLNFAFPLITFPYISRVLSVDELGKYNFSTAIVSYFLLIASLGITQYAIREGTQYRDNVDEMSDFASKVFSVNVVSMVSSYILLFAFIFLSNKLSEYRACILILSTQMFFTTIGTEWIFSIYEEYTYITVRSVVFKLISIVMLFLFVHEQGDYLKYSVVFVFPNIASNAWNIWSAKKFCHIRLILRFDWMKVLKPVLIILGSSIAIQIYVNSDMTMLGYFCTDYSVGIYSVSVKIYAIVKDVLAAVLIVTIPRFSLYAGTGQRKAYNSLLQKILNVLVVITIPAVIGLIALSKNAVLIIAGEEYLSAALSLRILSSAIIFAILNAMFCQCVLIAHKQEKIFLKCTTVSALVNIILNVFLIPVFAEVGAAITTLISEIILCIMLYVESKDLVRDVFLSVGTFRNLTAVITGSCIVFIICQFMKKITTEFWLQTGSCIVLSLAVYGLVLFTFKNDFLMSCLQSLKRHVRSK